jgi:hypothetical protein
MSTLPRNRILVAGLVGGCVLNLIDTPWSVLVMVPRLAAFSEAHQLTPHPLVGPWFLLAHFALMTVVAWAYAMARAVHGAGVRTALPVILVILGLNRAFGFANVLMGLMPLDVFLGFSLSFCVGVILAGLVAAWILDTRAPATVRT